MFGAILKGTNSSFQKGMLFCRGIYVKKVMKLLAFIFEQPSYSVYVSLNSIYRFPCYEYGQNDHWNLSNQTAITSL